MSIKKERVYIESDLEKQYKKYFTFREKEAIEEKESLEQPSAYKIIQSVTTYGAYDKPL
ncbi:MAG: hypothetical protein Q8P28_03630 [Deltaproteobacteria bacterium]|nr:hypothetical protein [Deltaproteobacteria bacterium]